MVFCNDLGILNPVSIHGKIESKNPFVLLVNDIKWKMFKLRIIWILNASIDFCYV